MNARVGPTTVVIIAVLCIAAIAAYHIVINIKVIYASITDIWGPGVAAIAIVTFASIPMIISIVHSTFRDRQIQKIELWTGTKVEETVHFLAARKSLNSLKVASLEAGYLGPMLALFLTILGFSTMLFTMPWFNQFFDQKSFFLGGIVAIDAATQSEITDYQRNTFTYGMFAFLGAYVHLLNRLWSRINNSDMFPNSYYYYAIRIIIAYIVAVVIRHTAMILGLDESDLLLLVCFVAGLSPDLFLVSLAKRAYEFFQIIAYKLNPNKSSRPYSMPLMMLDDLSREKIDRLEELGVDSAHILARANPFVLWARLPYELDLVLDWIAQAQLYVIVRESGLPVVRKKCVANVFHLRQRLEDETSRKELCEALGISEAAGTTMNQQLLADQAFLKLDQLRKALIPDTDQRRRAPPPRLPGCDGSWETTV